MRRRASFSTPSPADALTGVKLFEGLAPEALEQAVAAARRRTVPKGRVFFREGEKAEACHVLLHGRVKIQQLTPEGHQVLLRVIGPGDMFGCASVLGGTSYPGTGETLDDCAALCWGTASLLRLMEAHPRIGRNALAIVGGRLREIQDRYRELATQRVERRIAGALVRLASQSGKRVDEGVLIDFPVTRQELAEMTGTTLFTVSRVLSGWAQQGWIETGRQRIVISQPHRIAAIAQDL